MKRITALALVWAFAARAEDFSPDVAAELDRAVREQLAAHPVVGLSVGVLHDDRIWLSAYGDARLAPKVVATPQTSFRLASVTKTLTAVAVMQLVEEGKVDLDAEVQAYLPKYPRKKWPVTVRQLLSHLSGIHTYRDSQRETHLKTHHSTAQALALFQGWPLAHEPGTQFLYTTYGYNLLGAIIEAVSGGGYGAYLQRRVFGPLGMKRSAVEDREVDAAQWAWGYAHHNRRLVRSEQIDISSRFGGGGVRSTAEDLVLYARGLYGGELLQPETWSQMLVPAQTRDGHLADYGLGFAVYPQRGHFVAAHMGSQPETSTLLYLLPNEGLAVALLCNVENEGALLSDVASSVVETLLEAGRRRRQVYAANPADGVLADAMARIFSYGLARHAGMAAARGSDELPVDVAFAAAGPMLSQEWIALDLERARTAVAQGHQPHRGAPFAVVGQTMAGVLEVELGRARVKAYPALGPMAFFGDWLQVCSHRACPHFSAAAERDVLRLARAWEKTATEGVAKLRPERAGSAAELQAALKHFDGAELHPDLSRELAAAGMRWLRAGKIDDALAALLLGAQLHPGSPEAQLALADGELLVGTEERAEFLYRQVSGSTDSATALSLQALNRRAAALELEPSARAADASKWVREYASRLHPKGKKAPAAFEPPAPAPPDMGR